MERREVEAVIEILFECVNVDARGRFSCDGLVEVEVDAGEARVYTSGRTLVAKVKTIEALCAEFQPYLRQAATRKNQPIG